VSSGRTLLALDAAGSACSAAAWRGGAVVAHRLEAMSRGQSERLVPMIEEVMGEAGLAYRGLDAIAVTRGPGGFTGVRIGLATARGLALAWDRPIIAFSTLEAVAAATADVERRDRTILVLLDAKRADLYVQAFDPDLAPLSEPAALPPEMIVQGLPPGPLLLAGDGIGQAHRALDALGRDLLISRASALCDAAQVAALAARQALPAADAPAPTALYLRPPDVTPPPAARTP
jgi:tRNA threonylcarbamoyladenosine biosynthesis protein TsaB